ncbi:phosphoenolpyruvate--protein phosphotransferase [Humidisolicoccus flavus]|uniref:phosphoenolpyruvate--protein phosphotransferase n=1 Tax=Humidisolicoccus flavus TaxID=3111414 RepID=UPI0032533EAF
MTIRGLGVGGGIAVGTVLWMPDPLPDPEDAQSSMTPDEEYARAIASLDATARELARRAEGADVTTADILLAESLMATDPMVVDGIRERVWRGRTAERAVFEAVAAIEALLESLGGTQAERAADYQDVARRAIAHLRGVAAPGVPHSDKPFVLCATDLAPADTALLDVQKVRALVTEQGSPTSHTAILARALGIPAVVACAEVHAVSNGATVSVDAASGEIVVLIDKDSIEAALEQGRERQAKRNVEGPGSLADGTPVPLLANIGSLAEAESAKALGAEGIGLLRTEFLYIGAKSAPSVEQQALEYAAIFDVFPGAKVTARTLDSGADKPLSFLNLGSEENPALGVRGLRTGRSQRQILTDQLEALRIAGSQTEAQVQVMAPMVADAEETAWFVRMALDHGLSTAGVMIEVPSCALAADDVLERSSFVSIGTNDLTQYALAADRLHGGVAQYQDPWHPSVLKLIKMVGDAGRLHGKPVSVCGEAAADPLLAVVLVGLGVSSLSMSAAALADVRARLRDFSAQQAEDLAAAALGETSAIGARDRASELADRIRASDL